MKSLGTVVITMEFINYKGDVTESTEIARFRNMDWAESFVKTLEPDSDLYRYKIKAIGWDEENSIYITRNGKVSHDGKN
jgi:hypothetical protein